MFEGYFFLAVRNSKNSYVSADVGLVSQYRAIICMLILPSIINPGIWLLLKNKYKLSGVFIFALLMVGVPSPFFL